MRFIIGYLRCLCMIVVMLVGFVLILLLGWINIRIGHSRISAWLATWMARIHHAIFNIRFVCHDREKIRQHQGFLFPNHSTYLDIVTMLTIRPVRFLSESGNSKRPLIGYFAKAIDTVFVDRRDKASRQQARQSIAQSYQNEPHPPIVIFPEGRLNAGFSLLPFFHGAFEIAVENEIPYLPCAIRYSHPKISTWGRKNNKEGMIPAVLRVAFFSGPLEIELIPLQPVYPKQTDNAEELAARAKYAIEDALNMPHSSNDLPDHIEYG